MERLLLTLVVVGLIALALWGMAVGWRHRALRQGDIPAPSRPPAEPPASSDVLLAPVPGRYLASTTADDFLDRVVVHRLGETAMADLSVAADGVTIARPAATDVFVPASDVVGARLDRGIAGDAYEDGGVVLLTWRLGPATLDSGFRARDPRRHPDVVAAVGVLLAARGRPSGTTPLEGPA